MNISLIRLTTLGAIAILVSACGSMQGSGGSPEPEASKSTFEQSYQAAEDAYKKAKSVNNLWVNTEEDMEKAKEAASKGDFATAIKLAKRAKFESDAAYAQGESQKDAKSWLF
jgi:hypothetical protein